jgi:hypothetical protein
MQAEAQPQTCILIPRLLALTVFLAAPSLRQYLAEKPMPFDPKDTRNVAVSVALGSLAGAAIIQSHQDEKRKSQAEKDDPDGVEWICDLVWDLLDHWEPPDYEREDDYTDDLVQYLRGELRRERGDDDRRISVVKRTKTFCGIPDILVDDRLVLELKVDPRETEKDLLSGRAQGDLALVNVYTIVYT